jgi:hypothetical protein
VTGQTAFNEDYSEDDGGHSEFDWAELDACLGEVEAELEPHDFKALGAAQVRLLDWILGKIDVTRADAPGIITRRLIAFAWVLNPGRFATDAKGESLTQLAARLGVSTQTLSQNAADATRTFGIRNGAAAHAWNRKEAA